jgi:single-strand DNA-binding protein
MLNNCTFIGRCGQQPEIINTSGDKLAKVSLACSESWKDKNGDKKESTEWVNLEIWGNLAGIFEQYVNKGDLIYVSGKMKTDTFEKDGIKKYSTKIVVREMKMLGSKSDQGSKQESSNSHPSMSNSFPPEDDGDSDLPF